MSLLLVRGARIATAAFSPLDIAGLQLWLDASDASTLFQDAAKTTPATLDGDVIGAWADKSGNGNDATQATTANKPVLKLAIQNGRNVVRFDGVNDILGLGNLMSGVANATAFIVMKPDLSPSGITGWGVGLWEFGTRTDACYWAYDGNTIYDGFGTNDRRSVGSPIDLDQQFNLVEVLLLSAQSSYWLNGNVLMGPSSITVAWSSTPKVGGTTQGTVVLWDGDIAEVLTYNSALSTANRQAVEAYLNTRWAIY